MVGEEVLCFIIQNLFFAPAIANDSTRENAWKWIFVLLTTMVQPACGFAIRRKQREKMSTIQDHGRGECVCDFTTIWSFFIAIQIFSNPRPNRVILFHGTEHFPPSGNSCAGGVGGGACPSCACCPRGGCRTPWSPPPPSGAPAAPGQGRARGGGQGVTQNPVCGGNIAIRELHPPSQKRLTFLPIRTWIRFWKIQGD